MNFEQHLGIEQAKAISENMHVLVISSALINALLVFVLWPYFGGTALLAWLAVSLAVVVCRWWSTNSLTTETTDAENYSKRLRVHVFWSALNGAVWGSAALFFQDINVPIVSLYLICALTGYISVTVISNTLYLPQFFGFILAAAIPFVLSYVFLEGRMYSVLGAYAVIYTVVMGAFGKIANRNYVNAKRIEYENVHLLKQVTEEKESANRAINQKNQFLAATSHDLRQPLHALGLYADTLYARTSDPKDREIVEKLSESRQALNELLNGLLDISRLDASVVKNRPRHFALKTLVGRLSDEFTADFNNSDLELLVRVGAQHYVYADPVLLERVIRNLLSNAFKYTLKGSVSLLAALKGENVEISITDTGIGVPSDQLESIFTEFTQLDNPERDRNKGLGLGLSIVKRLCELQDIDYRFSSTLNKGTTVTLCVPLGKESLEPIINSSNSHDIGSLAILFVDDEQAIRDSMKLVIESWQCKPILASDKKDAMAKLLQHNDDIDLIITDLRLPNNENGLDVIEAVREELNMIIPAIIVTGDTAIDRVKLTDRANIVRLHKPIQSSVLRSQVIKLVCDSKQADSHSR